MHRRRFLRSSIAAVGLAGFGSTVSAQSGGDYRPGGPWAPNERAVNYEAYLDNQQLGERLKQIDRRSDRVELEQIGASAGREDPIWEVTIGDGNESLHLINQIHGDEPSGAEAVVKILNRLATGGSRRVETILDNLTITIVPRVNPDGANFVGDDGLETDGELRQRRYNTNTWEEGDSRYINRNSYFAGDVPGYDMNRGFSILPDFEPGDEDEDWWDVVEEAPQFGYLNIPVEDVPVDVRDPTVAAGENPYDELWSMGLNLNPENRAVTESFLDADPDWAITHHHQGAVVDPDSPDRGNGPKQQSIMSVMAPFGPRYIDHDRFDYASYVGNGNPYLSEDAQTRSLQLNQLVNEQAQQFGKGKFNTLTRYGYGPLWGSYLDALCPRTDAAGMLYEVSHQSDERGHKAIGTTVKITVEGFMATFERIADGSISEVDELDYFDMPLAEGIESPFGR
ncbi:M14 family zinc carboxypeptidase [Halorubrum lacusprofundi]|jgi:hypothetical protein|uniref:Peptidase M14 domain-containing protein n=1 Tax=Halorubrum lacusprofundi (strain ATCC 49239 / DSM 5036 / JCM 8891 / ACAM 34) TaxID=416348 RepID=B9LP81_HALLT|nr:M14 family zinc carboxypeptidase [Halorubrum lacusprofundi]ACM57169.1 hypothetical protein Hlac_1583 [Halorubrum lacusprofundi ATCC 49239]MCG1007306.1 peptidase M14 [Halorubrum lacusprofundi]